MSHRLLVPGVFALMLALCVLVAPCAGEAHHEPSKGAEGMAGAEGTFEFKPCDWRSGAPTYWQDTDGVQPGVAGCHVGLKKVGDDEYEPNDRLFGEACTEEGLLVESNPEAGKPHAHENDIGHPDLFDCDAWCAAQEGMEGGACQAASAPPCQTSARCVCE